MEGGSERAVKLWQLLCGGVGESRKEGRGNRQFRRRRRVNTLPVTISVCVYYIHTSRPAMTSIALCRLLLRVCNCLSAPCLLDLHDIHGTVRSE